MENIVQYLASFISQNNLIEQAFKDFRIAFNNWKEDSPTKYFEVFKHKELDSMNIFVQEVSLRASEWPECECQHVVITISIYDNNSYIGDYNWLYPISEKATTDDFLHIL